MREILFRGKTLSYESQWVEGFYNHIPCGRFMCDEHCIQTINEDGRIGQLFNVYESTVGQFTGLTDKNGTKIFEGDILRNHYFAKPDEEWDELSVVEMVGGAWVAKDVKDGTVLTDYADDNLLSYRYSNSEIIGNIHDNPELLTKGET